MSPSSDPSSPNILYFKHRQQTFQCRGNGLEYCGQHYVHDVKGYLPLLEPKRTKAGSIAVHQPHISPQPKRWWQAQCAFRGLSVNGNKIELQNRLREIGTASMLPELKQEEERLNADWREKESRAKEAVWRALTTNEEKAEGDPVRFLQEFFRDQRQRVVVLKTTKYATIHRAAENHGLEFRDTAIPIAADAENERGDRLDGWIVIGRSELDVCRKIADMHPPASRPRGPAPKQLPPAVEEPKPNVTGGTKFPSWQTSHVSRPQASEKTLFGIKGLWEIDCPYVQEQWGKAGGRCLMHLRVQAVPGGQQDRGPYQIWATFDFIVITGVMRFLAPTGGSGSASKSHGSRTGPKRKFGEFSQDDLNGTSQAEFIIAGSERPSTARPKWSYIWRGEETGEGQIQLGSEQLKGCTITFGGEHGQDMTGTFNSNYTGTISFTGEQCSIAGRFGPIIGDWHKYRTLDGIVEMPRTTLESEWNRRTEEKYEEARVARWR